MIVKALVDLGWSRDRIEAVQFMFPGSVDNTRKAIMQVFKYIDGLAGEPNKR